MNNKLSLQNIGIILRKELRSYFDSPTAYIVLVAFLLLWEFLFFRNAFLLGESSLRGLFQLLPWLFLLLIPALTMGSFSQEKSEGTLEILLTHPLQDIELLLGKFFSVIVFVVVTLIFTVPIAISFNNFGSLDWGVFAVQLLAGGFLASVFAAIGIFISSLFDKQITTVILTVIANLFITVIGFELITATVPFGVASLFEKFSVLTHFDSMLRGVIDLRDIWYFISIVILFLSLTYLQFLKQKYGNKKKIYRSFQLTVGFFVLAVVLTIIISDRIPGRVDVTAGKIYTVSQATEEVLSEVPDVVNITLYSSAELPSQMQPVLREIKDLLRDYDSLGKDAIHVFYKDPSSDADIATEALSSGIQEVQFNVIGNEEFQVKKGYLGIAITYAGATEAIPYVQTTSDLEYQLTSLIRKMTVTEQKKVAFLSGFGAKNLTYEMTTLNNELSKQFVVEDLPYSEEETFVIGPDYSVLVIPGTTEELPQTVLDEIESFIKDGGSVFFMIDTMTVDTQLLTAQKAENNLIDFLKEYGVEVRQDLVYDYRSNETVTVSGGGFPVLISYPFWVRTVAAEVDSPITNSVQTLTIPWGSSITWTDDILQARGITLTPLFITTEYGARRSGGTSIDPNQQYTDNNEISTVAVSLSFKNSNSRMVIVGDSDFLTDQFSGSSSENTGFGLEAISYLAQEKSLTEIQLKQREIPQLLFKDQNQTTMIKYGSMGISFFIPLGFGLYRLLRRKNLRKLQYHIG